MSLHYVTARNPKAEQIRCLVGDFFLRNMSISLIFCYEQDLDKDVLMDRLAQTLDSYPLFAGHLRLVDRQLFIDCDNSGVPFSIRRDERTLSQVLAMMPTLARTELVDCVDAKAALSKQAPVCSVRLTYCRGGGLVLGFSWSHAIGDLHTGMSMIGTWSKLAAGQPAIASFMPLDRPQYLSAHLPAPNSTPSNLYYLGLWDMVRFIFYSQKQELTRRPIYIYFGEAELHRMKETFSSNAKVRLSVNDALCAHMLSVVMKYDDQKDSRGLIFPVNFRRRLGVPNDALGNFASSIKLDFPISHEPHAIAREIRYAVEHYAEEHLRYHQNVRFIETLDPSKDIKRCAARGWEPQARNLGISNICGVGIYDVLFGGAPPILSCRVSSMISPWISSLQEGPQNRGILFYSDLPANLVGKLSSAEARKALHQFREPTDKLPELASQLQWML